MHIDGSQDGGWILRRVHKALITDGQAALWVMIDELELGLDPLRPNGDVSATSRR